MPRQHANARQVRITAVAAGGYEITLEWPDFDGESVRTFLLAPSPKKYMCGHAMAAQGLPGVVCSRAFDTRSQLTMHQKSVHELKPFGCINCGKLILDGSNYDKHVKSCTNEVPRHACTHCVGFSSHRKHNLQRHMRSQHPKAATASAGTAAGTTAAAAPAPPSSSSPPSPAVPAAVPTPPAAAAAPTPVGTQGYQQPALFQGEEQYAAPVGAFGYQQPAYAPVEPQYRDRFGYVYRNWTAYTQGEGALAWRGSQIFMEDTSASDFNFNSAPVPTFGPDLGFDPMDVDPSGVDGNGILPVQGTLESSCGGQSGPGDFLGVEQTAAPAAAGAMAPDAEFAADYSVPIDPALELGSSSVAAPCQEDDIDWAMYLVPSVREGWTSSAPAPPPVAPLATPAVAPIEAGEEQEQQEVAPYETVAQSEVFDPNAGAYQWPHYDDLNLNDDVDGITAQLRGLRQDGYLPQMPTSPTAD